MDSKNQPRILVEAESVLGGLAFCEAGVIELAASEALEFEVGRNPNPNRKEPPKPATSAPKRRKREKYG